MYNKFPNDAMAVAAANREAELGEIKWHDHLSEHGPEAECDATSHGILGYSRDYLMKIGPARAYDALSKATNNPDLVTFVMTDLFPTPPKPSYLGISPKIRLALRKILKYNL